MRSFKKLCSIKEVRPEFSTFSLYRICFITIKNKPYFCNFIIINTSSDDVKVTRNTHVFYRVCNTTDWKIGLWIYVNVVRTCNSLIARFVFCSNKNIVLSGFMFGLMIDVELFLPAVFGADRARSNFLCCKHRERQQ